MSEQYEGKITVATAGPTATIWLENPAQRNALTKDMCLQLFGAFAALSADASISVIVLRGVSGNFSAGIAIDQMDKVLFDRDEAGALVNHFDLVDRTVAGCGKITVAAVEGFCFGGAWQLAAACDMQLASDAMRLAITPAKIGLVFPRPGIERLVRCVGEHRARYLLQTGLEITAEQAEAWGMVSRLVPAAQFEQELERVLAALQANSPYAQHRTGRAVELAAQDPQALDEWWDQLWEENASNPDLAEGRAAFIERRPPVFGWRTEN